MKKIFLFNLPNELLNDNLINQKYFVKLSFGRDDLLNSNIGVFEVFVDFAMQLGITEDEAHTVVNYGVVGSLLFFFETEKECKVFFETHIEFMRECRESFNFTMENELGIIHSNT